MKDLALQLTSVRLLYLQGWPEVSSNYHYEVSRLRAIVYEAETQPEDYGLTAEKNTYTQSDAAEV